MSCIIYTQCIKVPTCIYYSCGNEIQVSAKKRVLTIFCFFV